MENYGKACVEVLEILKYIEKDTYNKINPEMIKNLEMAKDQNYKFEINKNIPLYENAFHEETLEILRKLLEDTQNNE